jgi:hypothetical protein
MLTELRVIISDLYENVFWCFAALNLTAQKEPLKNLKLAINIFVGGAHRITL